MVHCILPQIGFGTYGLLGWSGQRAIEYALDVGYRHLDTAQVYGNEHIVGRALRAARTPREHVMVVTKVWPTNFGRARLRASVQASLRRLGLDHVDLLLLHWPCAEVPLEETLAALLEVRAAGEALALGVSNFPPALLRRAQEVTQGALVANQVEYHPYLAQRELLLATLGSGALLVAHSPLAQGRVARDPLLLRIGRLHGKTAAQTALRWLVQQEGVAAVPKSTRRSHTRENLAVQDFVLTGSEMEEIAGLGAQPQRLVDPKHLAPAWSD